MYCSILHILSVVIFLSLISFASCSMLILASRQHTCIHPEISRVASKNEGCRDLLDVSSLIRIEQKLRVNFFLSSLDYGAHLPQEKTFFLYVYNL